MKTLRKSIRVLRSLRGVFLSTIFLANQLAWAQGPQESAPTVESKVEGKKEPVTEVTEGSRSPSSINVDLAAFKQNYREAAKQKRNNPIEAFYNLHREEIPYELRREMDYRLSLLKNRVPSPEVDSFGSGSNEVVRFRFKEGKNSLTLQISAKGEVEIFGTENGRSFRKKLNAKNYGDPLNLLKDVTGRRRTITRTQPSVQLLGPQHLAKLSEEKRRKYIDNLRETLALAEKVQNERFAHSNKTSAVPFWWFVEEAHAAGPSGLCVVAGWGGQYERGSCKPLPEIRNQAYSSDGKSITCNPTIYPEMSIALKNGRAPLDATAQCNLKTEGMKYQALSKTQVGEVRTPEDLQRAKDALKETLDRFDQECGMVDPKKALKDQPPTCDALRTRIREIRNATCEEVAKDRIHFGDLSCAQNEQPDDPGVPPADPPADGANGGFDPDCDKARTDQNCGPGGEAIPIDCTVRGQPVTKYVCECTGNSQPVYSNTTRPTRCEAPIADDGVDRERGREDRRERRRKSDGTFLGYHWSNWLAAGGILAAFWFGGKYIMNQKPWATPDPVIPAPPVPPPTGGSSPFVPSGVPVIQGPGIR